MRWLKGSATIEMAYIMPIIFLIFAAIIYTVFYFHDKNIMQGAAYETAVILSQKERLQESADNEGVFRERLGNKLIFFDPPAVNIEINEKEIIISAAARRKAMGISVEQKSGIVTAEKKLRDIRRIKSIVQE